MSGRGTPGGGLVRHHKPEDVKVTLKLRTTTSANTILLDPPSSSAKSGTEESLPPPFYIQIHASVKFSTHPSLPVTLATWRTPLERDHPSTPQTSSQAQEKMGGEEAAPVSSPVWLNSALTPLRSTTHPSKHAAPPALGYVPHRRGGYPRDLRESWDFITIPPADPANPQEKEGEEVVVKHLLPRAGLRFYSTTDGEAVMGPKKGEKFVVAPSAGGLGTFWWRWGDLAGDLAGKKFRADEWWDGDDGGEPEAVSEERGGGEWVESEGENGFGLTMEVENEAEIEFE